MVIVNQDRGMPDIGLWLYALTQHSMTNRYAALNENMIYHCPHDVVPLYEKRLYSAFQFMHQLRSFELGKYSTTVWQCVICRYSQCMRRADASNLQLKHQSFDLRGKESSNLKT